MKQRKSKNAIETTGITEQTTIHDPLDIHVEELLCNVVTVIPDVFPSKTIAYARKAIDALYALQAKAFKAKNLAHTHDANNLRCPLAYDDHFLAMATHKPIHAVIEKLLGKNYMLMMQNAVINQQDSQQYQSRWHRDLNYQHWTSSRPLALNYLITIDKFNFDSGATMVLPGSHRYEKFPSETFVKKHEICLEASPGSVLLMDAMAFHRSGINTIAGFTRRALNHVVGLPFMAQQIDIPAILKKHGRVLNKDPFLRQFLGYRWNPAQDVETWRNQRIAPDKKA